jgi:hypothetical protein
MKEEKTKCGNTSQSQDAFPHVFWKEIKKSKNHFIILSFCHFSSIISSSPEVRGSEHPTGPCPRW